MPQTYPHSSPHYLGEQGEAYFGSKFGSNMDFGRLFQSHFFRPYCSEELTLLDFGCANGLFLRNLPARERIGVEVNPHARQSCEQLSKCSKESIELHSNLETVESNRVDLVISNHCLEHTLHPFSVLKEMLRVLKPGGSIALILPFDDYRNHNNKSWRPKDKDNHLYTWSPMNIGNLLQEAGFEVEQIDIHTRAWSPKLFGVHRVFGHLMFRLSCYLLGAYQSRREVFGRAKKPIA